MEQREHTEQLRRYSDNAERTVQVVRSDPDRIQCEHIAAVLYDHIERIQSEALYAGQVEQCEEAVKGDFIKRVADIIQKELGR